MTAVPIERLIKLAIALLVAAGVTFAGVCAMDAGLHDAVAWSTGVQAFAMPLATLASTSGAFETPAAYWMLVAGGFLLWAAIGYLAGAHLLRPRSDD
jgi:hypothetical protein